MTKKNPKKPLDKWDISRTGQAWEKSEMETLLYMTKEGYKVEDIGKALKRSFASINSRLSAMGFSVRSDGIVPKFADLESLSSFKRPANVEIVRDTNQELFLWFMRHAWDEGVVITIPELGALFQKPKS